eukprot:7391658-Prymnesium_polylepis.1
MPQGPTNMRYRRSGTRLEARGRTRCDRKLCMWDGKPCQPQYANLCRMVRAAWVRFPLLYRSKWSRPWQRNRSLNHSRSSSRNPCS